jgi:hypothetical protein
VSADTLFVAATALVLPAWALLFLAPHWPPSARLIGPVIVPGVLIALYAWIVVVHLPSAPGGFTSLPALRAFFDRPWLLLGGWVHYLALDLFVGSFEVRDAQRHGIRRGWLVPCLGLTLMFAPLGLGAYLTVRAIHLRRVSLDD